jgi:hypothetical protein
LRKNTFTLKKALKLLLIIKNLQKHPISQFEAGKYMKKSRVSKIQKRSGNYTFLTKVQKHVQLEKERRSGRDCSS